MDVNVLSLQTVFLNIVIQKLILANHLAQLQLLMDLIQLIVHALIIWNVPQNTATTMFASLHAFLKE